MIDSPQHQSVQIHTLAPTKPAFGLPCNGCGLCCAAEPCPVSRVWLSHKTGACPALQWNTQNQRYQCGMVVDPAAYLRWMPKVFSAACGRLVHRWIAAGAGCDFDAEMMD